MEDLTVQTVAPTPERTLTYAHHSISLEGRLLFAIPKSQPLLFSLHLFPPS